MADDDDFGADGAVLEVNAVDDDSYNTLVPLDINPKAYSKYPLHRFVQACADGDVELLARMLDREDPINGYHHDINEHLGDVNALHSAAMNGQTEVIEMLLQAGADPHVRQSMPRGKDPKDGETAREMADKWGWDDIAAILKKAEEKTPVGLYMKYGTGNNLKLWPINRPQGLDPTQERRARRKHKGLVRSLPNKSERKFYGELVFGITHGWDQNGQIIRDPVGLAGSGPMAAGDEEGGLQGGTAEEPRTPIGLLFPGFGSQYKGMMKNARGSSNPKIKDMIATAERVLGFDILTLCTDGPDSQLETLSGAEPAILLSSLASLEALRERRPEAVERPGAVAGLAMGEYTALTVAGGMDFETALTLVKEHAAAIEDASKDPPQLMLSIAGIETSVVAELCEQAASQTGTQVRVSNDLFPKGCACGGASRGIQRLQELVTERGAIQTRLMPNQSAIHTPFMKPARTKVEAAFTQALPKLRPPRCDVYLAVTGKRIPAGTPPKDLIRPLCDALTSTVLWQATVQAMIAAGITEFYEVGPMKHLKAMMKRIDPTMWNHTENVEF